MTQHPGHVVPPSGQPWERASATPGPPPATVRAATALLVVLATLLGLLTLLVLVSSVAGSLMSTAAPTDDPARAVGRLVGGAVGVGTPLALTALSAWMAVAVRAGRTWPVRALTVLAVLGGLGTIALGLGAAWLGSRAGGGATSVLVGAVLLGPLVLVLALQVASAVLLRRPSAGAWAVDRRAGHRWRDLSASSPCPRT